MFDLGATFPTFKPLLTTGRMVRLSTDDTPTKDDDGGTLEVGAELLHEDTGNIKYWNGSAFVPVTMGQKLLQLIELQREIRDLLEQGD